MRLTPSALSAIMPHCPADYVGTYSMLLSKAMLERNIITVTRVACFLGPVALESGELRYFEERFSYSASRLAALWPSRFPSSTAARDFVGRSEAIANRVYANRLGNGDEGSGDGWLYRGRGPSQLTGRSNYRRAGAALELDLEAQPELAAEPQVAFRIATWFWAVGAGLALSNTAQRYLAKYGPSLNLNRVADEGDLTGLTLAWNGAYTHHEERTAYTMKGLLVLGRDVGVLSVDPFKKGDEL